MLRAKAAERGIVGQSVNLLIRGTVKCVRGLFGPDRLYEPR